MKNLNNKLAPRMILAGEEAVTAERAIHVAMFVLLLVGLCGISAWAGFVYVYGQGNNAILAIASVALSWGVILSVLYLGFRKLGWDWWI